METSTIQEGSRVKKGRRSRKSSSAVIDAQQAQAAGTDKAADLERPELEHSTISAVQERSDVKKGRRSKRRRSSAASLEAPKPEVIQQPSSASLQSGASTSIPGPPKPTLVKDNTEVDKVATKPSEPTGPAQPPQLNAGMVAVKKKEAVHGEAAVPARPKEGERADLSPQQHEGQARTRPSIRSTGVRSTGDPKTSNLTDNRRRLFIAAVMSVFALNALAMLWLLMRSWDNGEVQVDVPGLGIFRGLRSSIESRPVYMFRAIPFARSPVGPLRFADASAVPVDSRAEIDARIPKPGCAQKAYSANAQVIRTYAGTTEDCLHLNVWTPCTEYTTPGCRKTVLVFFHAIEFQNGDNNYYDGRWLAALGDLVVVAPNFRLGAFGFLNIGCLVGGGIPCTPSDVSLGDQRVAVQWVLDHIATFGGNASDVVLMGSGSGAWSVGAHVLEDETAGPRFWSHERFAKVILMSESPFRRYFDDKSHELPALLNCSLGGIVEVLHCVRVAPSREIVRLTSEMVRFFGPSRSAHPGVKDASRVAGRRFLLGVVSSEGTLLLDYLKRSSPPDANVDNVVPAFLDAIYHIKNAGEVIGNFRKATTPSDNGIYRPCMESRGQATQMTETIYKCASGSQHWKK
ncbi:acetylcholinesterase-like isoform X2 [Dermacentor albipictus]|uniref:acetylcholinesterase-like isoform X2 n=1 Tax=Dermacentor albipictus TaxID=60249 RepID=UPI0038FC7C95